MYILMFQWKKNTSLHRIMNITPYEAVLGPIEFGLSSTNLPQDVIESIDTEEGLESAPTNQNNGVADPHPRSDLQRTESVDDFDDSQAGPSHDVYGSNANAIIPVQQTNYSDVDFDLNNTMTMTDGSDLLEAGMNAVSLDDVRVGTLLRLREAVSKQSTSSGQGMKKCNCGVGVAQCKKNRCLWSINNLKCGSRWHRPTVCSNKLCK
ncbi:hypothetical protein QAD02_001494 [Eretmocerus hayati]|uniref:Uncharacterized protein n=1 Tax=Eretmocerus hayati TaxID=131215 RepID=A0ACC2NGE1_9HYME|nr:hypothetical protein QAD02_001494 [Eretmocerus hayati]